MKLILGGEIVEIGLHQIDTEEEKDVNRLYVLIDAGEVDIKFKNGIDKATFSKLLHILADNVVSFTGE